MDYWSVYTFYDIEGLGLELGYPIVLAPTFEDADKPSLVQVHSLHQHALPTDHFEHLSMLPRNKS